MKKLTTADFITKAQSVHGAGKYDYSQTVYAGDKAAVVINCPRHGGFTQGGGSHLRGNGCPACAGVKRVTLAEFLARAPAIHGKRYDYSQVVYTTTLAKIVILCPLHGPFEQKPGKHLKGQGCRKCGLVATADSRRKDTDTFLARAPAIHGKRYDYSQVVYTGKDDKVLIICRVHGPFEQTPHSHIKGRAGCPVCAGTRPVTLAQFLAKAEQIHGKRYDYSRALSIEGGKTPVEIGCREHGFFLQRALNHTQGHGCPQCGIGIAWNKDTLATFTEKAHQTHKNRYDYSQVEYSGSQDKIKIVCPEHGAFMQRPGVHIKGQGCPACGREQLNRLLRLSWCEQAKERECTLYFIRLFSIAEEFYKVGVTFNPLTHRYKKSSLAGYGYEVLALHKSRNAAAVWDWEKSIISTFAHLAYSPRRRFEGKTECFRSCEEILAIFPL